MSDVEQGFTPAQEYERDTLERAFRTVMQSEAGKRVVFWMLERCAIYQDAFSSEPSVTNYVLGRQAAGRDLIGMLDELDPRTYPRLLLDIAEIKEVDRAAAEALTANQENDDDQD